LNQLKGGDLIKPLCLEEVKHVAVSKAWIYMVLGVCTVQFDSVLRVKVIRTTR